MNLAMSTPRALLEQLIAFDTVSSASNLAFIQFVANVLGEIGAEVHIVPGTSAEKASLWATLGPYGPGGIGLSGHSDVVPVRGQAWDTDPFTLTAQGDVLRGRGTCDMKGFIACVLSAFSQIDQTKLIRPLHLAVTYDEEIGCLGAPSLIDWMQGHDVSLEAMFVGEPTMMGVVDAHKGICACRTQIRGVEAHSSLAHLGASAVGLAGRAIALIHEIETAARRTHRDTAFSPDYTTMSVNKIAGGEAINILAGHCQFEWDIRTIPATSALDIFARFERQLQAEIIGPLKALHPEIIAKSQVFANAPGLRADPNCPAKALALSLTGQTQSSAVPYAAEAGQYQEAGYPTIIIGPGSIEQAHQPNEYVALDQLDQCERFLLDLAARQSA